MAYKEVDMLFQREIGITYNIYVGEEHIVTTAEHPFWIKDKGWVLAKNMIVGDLFETSDSSNLAIDRIEVKTEHVTVYNFRVVDFHTYYVSNLKILTHNSECPLDGNGKVTEVSGNGADNIFKGELLKKDLKYTERYGSNARVELPDGRIRYYGEVQAANKPGEMVGRRVVQELDPKTGNVRTWQETLDASGNIRQVRPQLGPDKTHYTFDENGNYTGKW